MHLLLLASLVTLSSVQPGVPNRQPQMATSKEMTAVVFGSQGSIWFSKSLDQAKTFSTPVRVTDGKAMALGRHRGPHVVISGNTLVISAVLGNSVAAGPHAHGLPENGDLLAWRSIDGGAKWTGPVVIDDVPGAAREGLHAMAASPDGTIAAAWLDLRGNGTRVYGAYSKDGGAGWSKNVLLYEAEGGTVCQCCHPSLAADGNGNFRLMFRNVIGESRDLYLAKWNVNDGHVSKPEKVGTGSWIINACPMDGGSIRIIDGSVTTAWRRDDSVYLDRQGQPETEVGVGKDVSLAVTKQGAYVSWTGTKGIELLTPEQKQPILIGPQGSFSVLLSLPNQTVAAAWEHAGDIEISVAAQ